MEKYIGICGHRGAGKNSIAYLLANTIEYILEENKEDFNALFDKWSNDFVNDESLIRQLDLNNIYIASFSDDIISSIHLITGIPIEPMTDDFCKNNLLVKLSTFELVDACDVDASNILSHEELFKLRDTQEITKMQEDVWVSLRDFIIYYGYDVIQRFFGVNFWVKSLKKCEHLWECNWDDRVRYRIYIDTKTECERDFIKEKGGILIKVQRPKHVRPNSPISTNIDYKEDFIIENSSSLNDLKDIIYNLANKIIEE